MLTITWSFPWVGILYIAELWHSWSHQSACKSLVRYRQVCDRQQNGWQAYRMAYNKWEASWHSKKAHLCQDYTRHCTHGISFTHSNNPQSRNHYPRLTAQRNGHSESLKYTAPTDVTGNRVGVSVHSDLPNSRALRVSYRKSNPYKSPYYVTFIFLSFPN